MTFHLKIQKFIPNNRKILQQSPKEYLIVLEVDTSQRIRYLIEKGEIVTNQRLSLIDKEVWCTSGLKQSIQVVLYQRQKRRNDKQSIHTELEKMVRVATIEPETLLDLYKKNVCKNMEECIINLELKTRQKSNYLIKRDLPKDNLNCKVDICFKFDKFRISHGNMPFLKGMHRLNLSLKKQSGQKIIPFNERHQQTFNQTKQSLVGDANKNFKLSQKIILPQKKEDQPNLQQLRQQQTIFFAGRCGTVNMFSFLDNCVHGIDDSLIKFQIVQDMYR